MSIRGGGSGASPVTTMTRADVDRSGYATAAEALAAMPSNFAGMATEQSALSGADTSGANAVLATGVDLRALGTDATLVLVNGRRIAGSGLNGDIGDISSMPNVALDRVEVLTDGASALYGSDAVGGVVNILLKQRYDGAETRLRFGSVTSGGARETQLGQTLGTNWTGGGILAAYEYYHRGALASADRAFARSADSTPFGGTDHRYYLSAPGNILAFDPVTGAYEPAYAIRPGPSGIATTVGDFVAGATNLENFREGTDLTATQTRHSGYARLYQGVGDSVHLALDARYSRRHYAVAGVASSTVGEITAANPYFVSPDGAPYDLFAYSFYPELGPTRDTGTAEAMTYGASADVDLGAHWQIRSYAGFAQERDTSRADHLVDSASLSEALGTTPDDPLTPFSTAADGYFNPYGAGGANSRAILDFVGNGFTLTHTRVATVTMSIAGSAMRSSPLAYPFVPKALAASSAVSRLLVAIAASDRPASA
ncbi:TonB-dependent receptor plug domain-containing protein [Sphingomonas abietis]|uniref:TonB-dependent receptor plug domain-containing protein n=1 Tax=Sphingomonas abietis TaxID=3012344 RepID=A0ABY7NJ35_9SPHN|nr:TonB-dependent receptor plug domain-containing protein [Sphingomonas abietis]WBO21536.1 TonB-dependent receptor plug domain-containing protein [Sphingomonas abietis]